MTFSTLLAHLEAGRSNRHMLDVTAALAERFQAKVIGVAACQPLQLLYGEMYAAADLVQLDRDEIDRETGAAEAEFRAALTDKAKSLGWRAAVTCFPLADYICDQSRAADLIITSPDPGGVPYESNRRTDVGGLIMRAGRPVLIVPADAPPIDLSHVVVAWKDTREARRAVADALPFLTQAGRVSVVEIADATDMADAEARVADVAEWLEGHGVAAEADPVAAKGDTAAQIEAIARDKEAGLVVAGAYGHTRLREWVFGGVTRQTLMHPRRCTLVSH
jgi:nucleotide-binding universal stress UspA family protein